MLSSRPIRVRFPHVKNRPFDEVIAAGVDLQALGQRHEVELGIRQLRRAIPLQTTQVQGLRVPTPHEALRIKAFLCVERRAVRDFVDVAALAHFLGKEAALRSLKYLNFLYPSSASQTQVTRFAEVCEMEPLDLAAGRLADYKALQPPWNDWPCVQVQCQTLDESSSNWS